VNHEGQRRERARALTTEDTEVTEENSKKDKDTRHTKEGLFKGQTMTEFRGRRVSHEYTQTNCAPPETVFPLLCPVREAEWVPGWRYRLIHSKSGVAEAGCVFTTEEDGRETTWVVTEYDPAALRIGFVWVDPGRIAAQISIRLEPSGDATAAHIGYTYTGLSPEGNGEVERFDESWFGQKMKNWEAAINHYLRTEQCIDATTWE
jgi:hypothetical protein